MKKEKLDKLAKDYVIANKAYIKAGRIYNKLNEKHFPLIVEPMLRNHIGECYGWNRRETGEAIQVNVIRILSYSNQCYLCERCSISQDYSEANIEYGINLPFKIYYAEIASVNTDGCYKSFTESEYLDIRHEVINKLSLGI